MDASKLIFFWILFTCFSNIIAFIEWLYKLNIFELYKKRNVLDALKCEERSGCGEVSKLR